MMLSTEQWRGGEKLGSWDVLNEVVVSRGQIVRPIRLTAYVDGRWLTTYVADALIAATPTGSTAYALAAGGPILPPELRNILLVPVAPLLSLERPIVLAEGSMVSITVKTDHQAVFSIDGQVPIGMSEDADASQNRNTYKAILDIFPLENLNLGFEYRYRNINYTDTTYGLKRDRRNEFETSADYMVKKIAKIFGYADFGWIEFDPLQQKTEGVPAPSNWVARQKDRTYGYGIGTEIYAIPNKLTFVFQHDYVKSNGNVDFTLDPVFFTAAGGAGLNGIGANNTNIHITRWDDYTLYCFKIKAVYNFTKSLTAMIGYAYERFFYSDAQLNNYNFAPTGGTNAAFLTGAYKDQSLYTASTPAAN